MTPDEAKLLKFISSQDNSFPLIDVQLKLPNNGGFRVIVHNFTNIANGVCDNPNNIYSYLDNLCRLRIIDIPVNQRIKSDEPYKELEDCKGIKELLNSNLPDNYQFEVVKRQFELTSYGKNFIETCVIDK